ncbi:hypothetical protein ATER59S_02351 [Aquamicrobium terrae]
MAGILRQRAEAGWNTLLSPGTSALVAKALESYAPPPPRPPPRSPSARFVIDVFEKGSAIYKLDRQGEILEVVAWAQSTLAANATFADLVERNPTERFRQKRKSWVEQEN